MRNQRNNFLNNMNRINRGKISELLVKWGMPTRQAFINDLVKFIDDYNNQTTSGISLNDLENMFKNYDVLYITKGDPTYSDVRKANGRKYKWEIICPRAKGDCYPPFGYGDSIVDALKILVDGSDYTYRPNTTWTTKDGEEINIRNMTNKHLVNTYRMLYRQGYEHEWAMDDIEREVRFRVNAGVIKKPILTSEDERDHQNNRKDFLVDYEATESVCKDLMEGNI